MNSYFLKILLLKVQWNLNVPKQALGKETLSFSQSQECLLFLPIYLFPGERLHNLNRLISFKPPRRPNLL